MPEIRGLTGMRGLAALDVLLFHIYSGNMGTTLLPTAIAWLQFSGWSGVDFFFVLTGYLLAITYSKPDAKYFIRRVFRTFPLYYFVIIYTMVASGVILSPLYFIYAQNYFPQTFTSNPIWTLCIEELFYFVLFPIILIFKIKPWKLIMIGLVGSTIWAAISLTIPNPSWYLMLQMPQFFICYATGIAIARVNLNNLRLPRFSWILPVILFLAVSYYIGSDAGPPQFHEILPFQAALYSMTYGFIILFLRNSWAFTNKISYFLGKISYGVYILQATMLSYAHNWAGNSPLGIFLGIAGTIVVATLSYHVFEKRLIALGRRITSKKEPILFPNASSSQ